MAFERTEEYMTRITMDALDRSVFIDAEVQFMRVGPKIKAYCPETKTYLQFPRDLRREGTKLYADVVKAKQSSGTIFYRAYPGSIRRTKNGDSIA